MNSNYEEASEEGIVLKDLLKKYPRIKSPSDGGLIKSKSMNFRQDGGTPCFKEIDI